MSEERQEIGADSGNQHQACIDHLSRDGNDFSYTQTDREFEAWLMLVHKVYIALLDSLKKGKINYVYRPKRLSKDWIWSGDHVIARRTHPEYASPYDLNGFVSKESIQKKSDYSEKSVLFGDAYEEKGSHKQVVGDGIYPVLIELYKLQVNLNDMESAVKQLGNILQVDRDIHSPVEISKQEWDVVPCCGRSRDDFRIFSFDKNDSDLVMLYEFFNKSYEVTMTLVGGRIGGKPIMLPVWTFERNEATFNLLNAPTKYNLFNLHRSGRLVYLVDQIELADRFQMVLDEDGDGTMTWTSWYGGIDTVNRVDWTPLRNRTVYYVLTRMDQRDREDAYKVAVAVYAYLKRLTGIKLYFVDMIADSRHPDVMDHKQFMERVASMGFAVASKEEKARKIKVKTLNDVKVSEDTKYIVDPVIAHDSLTLIYGDSGVGKTWLALSLFFAAGFGEKLFASWKSDTPVKGLYLDGEMGDDLLDKRSMIIEKLFPKKPDRLKRNLVFHSMNDDILDLSKIDDQERVDELIEAAEASDPAKTPVSLIVLDNLSTLIQFQDTGKAWNSLFSWLKRLKERSISVVIVHHSNKKGIQRGAGIKTAVVDNVLYLEKTSRRGSSKLGMTLHVEKGRQLFGKATRPISIEMKPGDRKPVWKTVPRFKDPDERDKHVRELVGDGFTNAEIADDLGMPLSTFANLKKSLNLVKPRKG